MKISFACAAIASLCLFLGVPAIAYAAGELTVADVQSISGLTGIKEIKQGAIPGAGGNLNFVRADGKLLLLINIGKSSDYADAAKIFEQRTAVAGLGDEAFTPGGAPWALYVRKSSKMVGLGSGLDPKTGEQILTGAQIREIAKRILSRL